MKSTAKPMAYGAKSRKERDEELLLFREMFKREQHRNVSLLDPVSSEFESSQGNFPLYKLPSGKKEKNEFLGGEKEKNDYDWLKTPPATPLFPSLEMEANDSNMIFQRELPILLPIKPSRFSAKLDETKFEQRPTSPGARSTTSTRSDSSSRSHTRCTSSSSSTSVNSSKRSTARAATNAKVITTSREKPRTTSTPRIQNSNSKPQSRGVSPMTKTRLPATLPGFSNEAPPNLITSVAKIQARATSATRGRPGSATLATSEPKVDSLMLRRPSCSPSASRGRQTEPREQTSTSKGNGTLIIGSKMVERMMNARRSAGAQEKDSKVNEKPGIGRLMSRPSIDMALKQLEISKNAVGLKPSKQTATTGPSSKLSSQTTASSGGRNTRIRASSESKFTTKIIAENRIRN